MKVWVVHHGTQVVRVFFHLEKAKNYIVANEPDLKFFKYEDESDCKVWSWTYHPAWVLNAVELGDSFSDFSD